MGGGSGTCNAHPYIYIHVIISRVCFFVPPSQHSKSHRTCSALEPLALSNFHGEYVSTRFLNFSRFSFFFGRFIWFFDVLAV